MFNSDKKIKKMVFEMLDIVKSNNDNITTLQEALEQLGSAVSSMHDYLLLLEERVQFLEKDRSKK
jgi:DNA-binding IclR family transcriptional regulator